MDTTKCPYLATVKDRDVCGASSRRMFPSELAFENYCSTEEHYRCPMVLIRMLLGGNKGRGFIAARQRGIGS